MNNIERLTKARDIIRRNLRGQIEKKFKIRETIQELERAELDLTIKIRDMKEDTGWRKMLKKLKLK